MAKDLINRYIWLADTIRRRGRMTRAQLNESWQKSALNTTGTQLCRRTLYNYRNAIAAIFNIDIQCDPVTYEYYIAESGEARTSVSDWLLNARAMADTLTGATDISNRIFLEDVPSARGHLGTAIDAIRQSRAMRFDYYSYSRSRPTRGVVIEPYFLRIFKQRWYVIGRNVADGRIKTYALDRLKEPTLTDRQFAMDDTFTPAEYFRDAFGIVVTRNEPRRISLRADSHTAHYLRDLPLHHSQQEVIHDNFSIFYYRMYLSEDLVREITGYGPRLTVIDPPELKAMVMNEHRAALAAYTPDNRT